MKYGNAFLAWLPLAAAITGMCLLVYGTVQQDYRQSLNDPQVQIAEDAARVLATGAPVPSVVPQTQSVDIARSLAPWVAVYDDSGKMLGSTGVLDDAPPILPQGVFDAAQAGNGKDTSITGQDRVTWQPQEGVRSAVVVQHFSGTASGFVASGRNMREVEDRETRLSVIVGAAWLVLIVSTLILQLGAMYLQRR